MTRPTIQARPGAIAVPVPKGIPPRGLPPRPRDRALIPCCILSVVLSVAFAATLERAWTAQIQHIVELQQ